MQLGRITEGLERAIFYMYVVFRNFATMTKVHATDLIHTQIIRLWIV